jgi:cob(I)alamin adenosyltransferase
MRYFTGKGDQGKSSLADGRLISKGDLAFEVIGSLDEATAHLGMAISLCQDSEIIENLRSIQIHLSKLMGFIAGVEIINSVEGSYLTGALEWLEDKIKVYGDSIDNPEGFIFAGQSSSGAAIDIARTVIRCAERKAVRYYETVKVHGNGVLTYLNRLSSFLFIFRLFIDHQSNSHKK